MKSAFSNNYVSVAAPFIRGLFFLLATLFAAFCQVLALPTNAVIVRFANENYFSAKQSQKLFSGLQPVFPELLREDKLTPTLSSSSLILGVLKRYAEIRIPVGADPTAFLREIRASVGVEYADFAKISRIQEQISNDSLVERQWALARIRAAEAWKVTKGAGVIVGVLDTGVDFFHPDLTGQFAINSSEDINQSGTFEPWPAAEKRKGVSGDLDGIDNDGNGFADDVIGYDFVDQGIVNTGDDAVRDPIPADENGHGTSVAGVIASKANNFIGVAGVAPDACIKALRCHDATGNAEEDDIAAAIIYAAMNGVRVLNMSFGDVVNTPLTRDALAFAASRGCILVASAGNDGADFSRFPASYPGVIAVGAATESDKRAPFSSYGSQLAISAPGVNIWTTAAGGKYRSFQGTSASAPHVSASVALLLAVQPDLSSDEVRGVLQASAEDLGAKGWDPQFGAGMLDCAAAVKAIGRTIIRIESPINDDVITNAGILTVYGAALTPLLSSWSLEIAAGENPSSNWNLVSSGSIAANRASALGVINVSSLKDTTYVLRLTVQLSNGNSIENRVRFNAAVSKRTPAIVSAAAKAVWRDDARSILFTVKTDRPSRCFLRTNSKTESFYVDNDRFAKRHEFLLSREQAGDTAEFVCCYPGAADSSKTSVKVPFSQEAFPTGGFKLKSYSAPPAQLSNYVRDFYSDGKPVFAINDISTGDFGDTKTIQFDGGKLVERDKTTQQWIPRGLGDSNGDGIMEILAHSFSDARLFQGKTISDSPFSDTIFTENSVNFAGRNEFYSAGMYDIDGDGREEILGFSDTACLAYTFKNGKYSLLAVAPNDSRRDNFGSPNRMRPPVCFAGDFDGNGKVELFYGDADADFLIFEYDNGKFTRKFLIENDGSGGTEFCVPTDVDGDGRKEFLIGYYSQQEFTDDREYEPPLWTYKLLKSTGPNQYDIVWEDSFYGVRVGSPYANGVSAGDLDGLPGDEIALFPFPNAYVMRWDKTDSTFRQLWYTPFQYSNTAIIYDFDKNGVNELGYCDGNSLVFVECEREGTGPGIPTNFTGYAINANTAALHWSPAPYATEYQVFAIRDPAENNNPPVLIASTSDTALKIDNLTPNTLYRFFLRGVRLGAARPEGDFALPIDIFTREPLRPISAFWRNNSLFVKFSADYLPARITSDRVFTLRKGDNSSSASYIHFAGDSIIIARFEGRVAPGLWQLDVASFNDRYGAPTERASLEVNIDVDPEADKEMILLRLENAGARTMRLLYSEPIRANDAVSIANYELRPTGAISSVEMDGDSSVIIRLAGQLYPIGSEYALTVRNVSSVAGVPIARGAGNTLGFILFGENENGAYCYPNPFHIATDDDMTFAGLPRDAEVAVYTIDMNLLTALRDTGGAGGVRWRPVGANGEPLNTGTYFFKVKGRTSNGVEIESNLVKFGVIR